MISMVMAVISVLVGIASLVVGVKSLMPGTTIEDNEEKCIVCDEPAFMRLSVTRTKCITARSILKYISKRKIYLSIEQRSPGGCLSKVDVLGQE